MAKVKFLANWESDLHKQFNIPSGRYLLFEYDQFYKKTIGNSFGKLNIFQNKKKADLLIENNEIDKKDYLRQLEITVDIHYKKRTLDQNKLKWALYDIEANEQNGGMTGSKEFEVQPMDLYLEDLKNYGERETIVTKRKNLNYYASEYRIIEIVKIDDIELSHQEALKIAVNDEELITITVIRGTSKLNTKDMSIWIERLFNRIAINGIPVTNSADIETYWKQWKEYLNDNKINVHDTIMTQDEYKELNPLCEACGSYVAEGFGELSHIKSVGMGRDRTKEPTKNYSSNWLHLCVKCHREVWHQHGYKEFLKRFKHLTHKVNTALNMDYSDIDQDTDDFNKENVSNYQEEQENAITADYEPGDEDLIIQSWKDGKINQDRACILVEEIGGDPTKINPEWIGLL